MVPDASSPGPPPRARRAGLLLATVAVVGLPILLLAPALLPGRVLSSADVLLENYPFASLRPPDFVPANSLLTDPVQQMIPWRRLMDSELRAGRLPFWNPYAYAGSPLLGDSQSALFDPLSLPYLLASKPSEATVWVALLRALVAAIGALLLARTLGLSAVASALAGLAYGCGGFMTVWLLYPLSSSAAWLPWALLAAERLARSTALSNVVGLGLAVTASVFGGNVEVAFLLALTAAVWAVWRRGQLRGWRPRHLGTTATGLAVAGMLAVLLSAVHTLPFLESLREGTAASSRAAFSAAPLMPTLLNRSAYLHQLIRLALVAFPYLFGRPLGGEVVLGASFTNFCEHSFAYVSILGACLVVIGALRSRGASAARALALIAPGVWLYCNWFPPFVVLAQRVPVLQLIFPERAGFVVSLALALLAAFGLDELSRGQLHPAARRMGSALAVLAAAAGFFAIVAAFWMLRGGTAGLGHALHSLADPAVASRYATSFLIPWAAVAWATAAMLWFLAGARYRRRAEVAVLVVVADLGYFAAGYNPAIPASEVYPSTPATRAIHDAAVHGRAVILDYGMVANVATYYAIPDLAGYDALNRRRLEALAQISGAVDRPHPGQAVLAFDHFSSWFFNVMAVDTVVARRQLDRDHLVLERVVDGARIYRNTSARPFAFAPAAVTTTPDPYAAAAILGKGGYDRATTAVVETHDAELPASPGANVRWRRLSPAHITLGVDSVSPATVVIAEGYDAGWSARVDGRPTPVLPSDLAVMAVVVPAGRHTVDLAYQPRTWPIAVALSLCGGLLCASLLLVAWRAAHVSVVAPPTPRTIDLGNGVWHSRVGH